MSGLERTKAVRTMVEENYAKLQFFRQGRCENISLDLCVLCTYIIAKSLVPQVIQRFDENDEDELKKTDE